MYQWQCCVAYTASNLQYVHFLVVCFVYEFGKLAQEPIAVAEEPDAIACVEIVPRRRSGAARH